MILILLLVLGFVLFAFAGVAFIMEVHIIHGSADQAYLDSFERIPGRQRYFGAELLAES